jgi:hypothetical protein
MHLKAADLILLPKYCTQAGHALCEDLISHYGGAAVVGNIEHTGFSHCIGPYVCPESGTTTQTRHRILISRKPRYDYCDFSEEYSAVRRYCSEFVAREASLTASGS